MGIWRTKNGGYVPWHGVRTQLQMGQSSWGDLATIVVKKLLSGMILRVWATNGPTKGLGFHPFWWFSFCVCLSAVICLSHLSDLSLSNHLQWVSRYRIFQPFYRSFRDDKLWGCNGPPMKKIHQQECPSGNPHELGVSKTELFDDKPFFKSGFHRNIMK